MDVEILNFVLRKPMHMTASYDNGGSMDTANYYQSGTNDMFSDLLQSERGLGKITYKKAFVDTIIGTAVSAYVGISNQAWESVNYQTALGSATDIQTNAKSYAVWHGAGRLKTAITANTTTAVEVTFVSTTDVRTGDTIALIDWNNRDRWGEPRFYFTQVGTIAWTGVDAVLTSPTTIIGNFAVRTRATIEAGNASPYSALENTAFLLRVSDDVILTLPFVDNPTSATDIASIIHVIGSPYFIADANGSYVRITHNKYGRSNKLEVIGGNANDVLNFPTNINTGTDGTVVSVVTILGTVTDGKGIWIKETVAQSTPAVSNNWFSMFIYAREQ